MEQQDKPTVQSDDFEWAIVEIFGHRRHVGRIREEERFGTKMLRIDVPTIGAVQEGQEGGPQEIPTWTTHWYGGSSIFSLTLTDEASAVRINQLYSPPQRYIASPNSGPDFDEVDA